MRNLFFLCGTMATTTAGFAASGLSITSTATVFTQDFNSLSQSGTGNGWTDASTLGAGWYINSSGTFPGTYDTANQTTTAPQGKVYSFGNSGTPGNRALGGVSAGTGGGGIGNIAYGILLQNNTGAALTQFDISYLGETWYRDAGADTITFGYSINNAAITDPNAAAFTALTALDYAGVTGALGEVDGSNATFQTQKRVGITTTSVANGSYIMFIWKDANRTGNDLGMAIDNVRIQAPEPGTYAAAVFAGALAFAGWYRRRRSAVVA